MSLMEEITGASMDLFEAAADEAFLEELGTGRLDRKIISCRTAYISVII